MNESVKLIDEFYHKYDENRGNSLADILYNKILLAGEDFNNDKEDDIKMFSDLMNLSIEIRKIQGKRFIDFFGDWMTENNRLNGKMGQVLTPEHIVDLMVMINIDKEYVIKKNKKGSLFSVIDPACGTGRFMIGVAKYFMNEFKSLQFEICNIDIDFKMWVCTTMNAILNGVASITIWGNALTNEVRDVFMTSSTGCFSVWRKAKEDEIINIKELMLNNKINVSKKKENIQLELF